MKFTSFALAALAHHLACAAPTPVSDEKIAAAAHHHPSFPSGFPVASGGAAPSGFAFTGEKIAGAAFPSEHPHHHFTGSGAALPTGFAKSERDLEKGFAHHSGHHGGFPSGGFPTGGFPTGGFPTGSGFPVPTGFRREARAEGAAHASEHHHHHHHSSGVFPSGGALPTGFLKAEVEALNKFFPTGSGAGVPFPTGAFPSGGFKGHGEHEKRAEGVAHASGEHHHHHPHPTGSGAASPTGFLKSEKLALEKAYAPSGAIPSGGFPFPSGSGFPFPSGTGFPAFPTGTGFPFKHTDA